MAAGDDGLIGHAANTAPLERYDPAADRWTALADLPLARQWIGGGAIGGSFCIFGGGVTVGRRGHGFIETHCYDPASDAWQAGPSVPYFNVAGIAAAELGGDLYAIGGAYYDGAVWRSLRESARLSIRRP